VAPAVSAAELPRPTVSHTTVKIGETFTISGTGCFDTSGKGSLAATITSLDGEIGNANEVKPDGSWSFKEMFVPGAKEGTYRIQAVCAEYDSKRKYPLVTITLGNLPVPAECASGCTTVAAGAPLTPEKGQAPGEKRMLRLTGYLPNEVVTLILHSTPQSLGTFTADSSGTLTVAFTVPAGTSAGAHNLVVTRADGSTVTYPVTVAAATPRLAATGADVTVPLALGVGLVIAGGGMLLLTRGRRGAAQA
jgi:hypothetical protein